MLGIVRDTTFEIALFICYVTNVAYFVLTRDFLNNFRINYDTLTSISFEVIFSDNFSFLSLKISITQSQELKHHSHNT